MRTVVASISTSEIHPNIKQCGAPEIGAYVQNLINLAGVHIAAAGEAIAFAAKQGLDLRKVYVRAAWVTTVGPSGVVNAAPFSFFNVFAEDPPLCMVAINKRRDGRIKDTWTNIERSGEFVVNLTDEPLALKMHESSGDFPPDIGEPDYLGLKLALSVDVRPPRLADAPWSMECRVWQATNVKDDRQLVIGEGLRFHIRDELWDPKAMRVHMDRYHPVGRMFADRYCRTNDRMEFPPAPVVKAKAAE
jgi:flavin reductase (DIM6/NTAB) family NADH-FMN oxidoreductase RutF